jgi:hypothetical protein
MFGLILPFVGILVATIAASFLGDGPGKRPYFPIEVSRMLASGVWAQRTFQVGVLFAFFLYGLESKWHAIALVCCAGVSVFDDVTYWALHMAWCGGMALAVFLHALGDSWRLTVFFCALIVYGVRMAAKGWVLIVLEQATGLEDAVRKSKAIMYTGVVRHPWTLVVFQGAGVVQWIVFLLFAWVM